jgi:mono/diheme cytochrome c family protein
MFLACSLNAIVLAQQIGDADAGLEYASKACSQCHAILRDQPFSPLLGAPRFEDIANTPELTINALLVWFQTSHPTMPNIIISETDTVNVIEYILSLREK